MVFLEEKMYQTLPEIFDQNFTTYIKENWKRYLDDCFIFWTKTEYDLRRFHSIINNIHESIKFTMETSGNELPFLDIRIIKRGNIIITEQNRENTKEYSR